MTGGLLLLDVTIETNLSLPGSLVRELLNFFQHSKTSINCAELIYI